MKRILAAITLGTVLAVALAGCAGTNQTAYAGDKARNCAWPQPARC